MAGWLVQRYEHDDPEPSSRGSDQHLREALMLAALSLLALSSIALLVAPASRHDGAASKAAVSAPGPGVGETRPRPLEGLERHGRPQALGSPTAAVVLVEYGDLRCTPCGQFTRNVEPALIARYVNTGVLRLEWRDLPMFGPQSMAAARAARAASTQGRFWQYIHTVYAAPASGQPDLTRAKLDSFAAEAGVPDLRKFDTDASSTSFDDAINDDKSQALRAGIVAAPAYLINGQQILGGEPMGTFMSMIDNFADKQPAGRP